MALNYDVKVIPLIIIYLLTARTGHYFSKYMVNDWRKSVALFQRYSMFSLYPCNPFFTWKRKTVLCGDPYHLAPLFFCRARVPLSSVKHFQKCWVTSAIHVSRVVATDEELQRDLSPHRRPWDQARITQFAKLVIAKGPPPEGPPRPPASSLRLTSLNLKFV